MAQINKPNTYFNTVLYTGNATDNHTITGVNFQPDWVWVKGRSEISSHRLNDAVRGAGKELLSNTGDAEYTYSPNTSLKSFDSDGFTLGTDNGINKSSVTYASWNWLAGGTAVSNTQGSITSSVSANQIAGFSIVSYTGTGANATVGHGLTGSAPNVVIIKRRNSTGEWVFGHSSLGFTKFMEMNSSGASQTSSTRFNDTAPTSSVFSIGTAVDVSTNGGTYIAYCFAEKKGFSKFGSYVGNNGGTDGVFVYTGFKPALVIQKLTSDAGGNWLIRDNKRNTFNTVNSQLESNTSDAEETNHAIDFLSNGFKTRANGLNQQDSGYTYIYMAFAENPLVGTNNVPATAR